MRRKMKARWVFFYLSFFPFFYGGISSAYVGGVLKALFFCPLCEMSITIACLHANTVNYSKKYVIILSVISNKTSLLRLSSHSSSYVFHRVGSTKGPPSYKYCKFHSIFSSYSWLKIGSFCNVAQLIPKFDFLSPRQDLAYNIELPFR